MKERVVGKCDGGGERESEGIDGNCFLTTGDQSPFASTSCDRSLASTEHGILKMHTVVGVARTAVRAVRRRLSRCAIIGGHKFEKSRSGRWVRDKSRYFKRALSTSTARVEGQDDDTFDKRRLSTSDQPRRSSTGDQGRRSSTGGQGRRSSTGGQGRRSSTGDQRRRSSTGDQRRRSSTGDRRRSSLSHQIKKFLRKRTGSASEEDTSVSSVVNSRRVRHRHTIHIVDQDSSYNAEPSETNEKRRRNSLQLMADLLSKTDAKRFVRANCKLYPVGHRSNGCVNDVVSNGCDEANDMEAINRFVSRMGSDSNDTSGKGGGGRNSLFELASKLRSDEPPRRTHRDSFNVYGDAGGAHYVPRDDNFLLFLVRSNGLDSVRSSCRNLFRSGSMNMLQTSVRPRLKYKRTALHASIQSDVEEVVFDNHKHSEDAK